MEKVYEYAAAVLAEVKRAIAGKDACITKAFATILAGGHILIEDVPGVGKTTLAIAFSRVMGLLDHRVQFTPDVLPADIVGFNMYQKETGQFVYHPGTIMCNLFLADEINRTSPKTQSALLEVMEEGKVTVDGVSRKVPQPKSAAAVCCHCNTESQRQCGNAASSGITAGSVHDLHEHGVPGSAE